MTPGGGAIGCDGHASQWLWIKKKNRSDERLRSHIDTQCGYTRVSTWSGLGCHDSDPLLAIRVTRSLGHKIQQFDSHIYPSESLCGWVCSGKTLACNSQGLLPSTARTTNKSIKQINVEKKVHPTISLSLRYNCENANRGPEHGPSRATWSPVTVIYFSLQNPTSLLLPAPSWLLQSWLQILSPLLSLDPEN